ncbi:MAG: hypothetical protein V3575_05170 [Candidatus Absconditabacteria bacterium]
MRKIKLAIGAFILGQLTVMLYKDESIKGKFERAKGFDKLKVIFHGLVDFNKSFFTDLKEYNYEDRVEELTNYYNIEKGKLESKIEEIKNKLGVINKDKIQPTINDLEEKIEDFKVKLETQVEEINNKYKVDKKIEKIKGEFEKGVDMIKDKIEKMKKDI